MPNDQSNRVLKDQRKLTMNTFLKVGAIVLCAGAAQANYVVNVPVGASIPDNDPSGVLSSTTVSGVVGTVFSVSVTLAVSNGFNGDYYAMIEHNGAYAVLFNRVGLSSGNSVGYADPGVGPDGSAQPFTFADAGLFDVHWYATHTPVFNGAGQLTGVWQPDGRELDPQLDPPASFDAAPRTATLAAFDGADPNGDWNFFIADVAAGSEGTLVEWGLNVQVVPEPGPVILLGLLGLGGYVWRVRRRWQK